MRKYSRTLLLSNLLFSFRICLTERENMSKSLFEFFIIQNSDASEVLEDDEISFSSIYCELTGCLITEENNQDLTSSVCEECSEKLLISYELKKRSSEVESKIQEYCRLREEQQKEMEKQIVEEEFTEDDSFVEIIEEPKEEIVEAIIEEPKKEIVEARPDKKVYLIFDEESSKDAMKMELFLESKTEDGQKFVCPLCPGRTFKAKRSLKKHICIHLQDKRYQCQHCEERFVHASTRDQHQIKQHQPKDEWKFCCPFDDCDQRFYRRDKMKIHIKAKHTLEYNFRCDIPDCRAKFVEKSALNKHLLTHNPEKTFLCPMCPNQYKMKKNLVYHLKAAHGQEGESFCVELTGKQIPKIKEEICEEIMEIIEEADKDPPPKFVCEMCGAKFREIRRFKDHTLKHGKVRIRNLIYLTFLKIVHKFSISEIL